MICAIVLIFTVASAESISALLFALFLHEAAHIFCALVFFRSLPRLHVTYCGLRLRYDVCGSTAENLLLSLSGPLVNLLMWLLLPKDSILAIYSLSLGIFNLLPCGGLDGGEITRALSHRIFGEMTGRNICTALTAATVFLIFAANCAVQLTGEFNLSLLLVTLYLIIRTYGK